MGSRVRIRFFEILHFVRDLLFPLLKNSKSGSHMIGTTSLAPRWSASLRDYPGAAPRHGMRQLKPIRKNWGMIGRHQVNSKWFLGVSFTGECKLIFQVDYLKTKVNDDVFTFYDKILDSQQILVKLLS